MTEPLPPETEVLVPVGLLTKAAEGTPCLSLLSEQLHLPRSNGNQSCPTQVRINRSSRRA
jgi:hypothetical protein